MPKTKQIDTPNAITDLNITPKSIEPKPIELFDTNCSVLENIDKNDGWENWLKKVKDEGVYDVSFTKLKQFDSSPLDLIRYISDKTDKTTPAMAFGKLVHCLVLEPKKFDSKYLVSIKKLDKRTIEYAPYLKIAKERGIAAENIICKDDYLKALVIRELFLKERTCKHIMTRIVETEKHFYFDYWYNEKCFSFHGYVDAVLDNGGICDLKTMSNVDNWRREIVKNRYDIQAVIYLLEYFLNDKTSSDNKLLGEERYNSAAQRVWNDGEYYFLLTDNEGVKPSVKLSKTTLFDAVNKFHDILQKMIDCNDWKRSYPFNEFCENLFIEF